MQTITVTRTIKAPIEKVFELISDHANYAQFGGLKSSKLLREGKTEKNGLGALREIDAGLAWFQEEVTVFERPTRMDYLIVKSRPPIEHQGGSVCLKATPAGTEVVWTSTLRVKIPVIGGLLTRLAAPQLGKGFAGMLKAIERRLAA
ncbi:MAG: SRPBCC family protein [Nevskiales bacterium]